MVLWGGILYYGDTQPLSDLLFTVREISLNSKIMYILIQIFVIVFFFFF